MSKIITHASLFSGIGGPEVAAAMLGWKNAFHCEINPFGRSVLEYWFPESVSYEDITKTNFEQWRGRIDVLTGGFPCQPFSYAGRRGGREDERYLWPQMLRAINEIRPTWVVGENVAGITTMVEGGYVLKWEASPLFSERVTVFTDTNFSKPSPSNASAATLNAWDIPSSRCLFRLRLSELPTEGTESSSSPMMLTPTAVMTCESPERMRERAEKNGYKNGTKYGSLESQIMYGGMLPTPQAGEGEKYRLKYVPGSQMGTSLSAMAASGLLPTPTARDEKNPSSPDGERIQRKLEQGWTIELNDLAAMGTLPGTIDRIMAKGQDGQTSRLSPLFTEEMMGFPFLWTTLPFLRQDGEPKALKPTEMP